MLNKLKLFWKQKITLKILHRNVDCIERRQNGGGGVSGLSTTLVVKCKNLRAVQVDVPGPVDDFNNVADSLEKLAAIGKTFDVELFIWGILYHTNNQQIWSLSLKLVAIGETFDVFLVGDEAMYLPNCKTNLVAVSRDCLYYFPIL